MRGLLPDADEEVLRHPVERREARRRWAEVVRFVGARTRKGEVASWADPTSNADPASGTARIEQLLARSRGMPSWPPPCLWPPTWTAGPGS
ncbi:hypothetical protein [Streptomyces sp. NPDC091259]|uniref:hypothetical protein n=1 Tax=Streptomyces sp. NPDC091259 TaxID=3365976 RepID=UPI0037F5A691